MTESMLTTRLSSVITGCGGNETTCSRRSMSRPHAVDEGDDQREPGRERARVAAEALDDCGAGLRDDADRPRQGDEDDEGDDDDDDHGDHGRDSAPSCSLPVDEGCGALDLHDLDLRADVERLVGHVGAGAPLLSPILTRPPRPSTRWRTTAFAPSSAAAPVRIARGIVRWRRAIGRRRPTAANEPTPKTTICSQTAPPTAATTVEASAARAIGPRKKSPGVKISPTARRTATTAQTTQAGMPERLRL